MTKFTSYFDLKPSFLTIKIRGISDSAQGLTALRLGTIVAFVSNDENLLSSVQKDETLLIHKCPIGNVISRRTLKFSCSDSGKYGVMDFSNLRFLG